MGPTRETADDGLMPAVLCGVKGFRRPDGVLPVQTEAEALSIDWSRRRQPFGIEAFSSNAISTRWIVRAGASSPGREVVQTSMKA